MIKINLKVTNFEATPDVKLYLDKKLAKIKKFVDKKQDEVILRVEIGKTTEHHKHGEVFRAEIETHLLGKDFRAEATEEDLFAAIDKAKDDILREIKGSQEKSETIIRREGRRVKELIKKMYK
jgi:putative sigma-54 modulation protein